MSSNKQGPQVLICDAIAEAGLDMLREHAEVEVNTGLSPAELSDIIGDYEAVVVRSATKLRADVLQHARRLKVIGRAGAGLDNIDVAYAQEQGIKVVNAPDANTRAVAEHTLALLLALARHLPSADASMKAGRWEKKKLLGIGLTGKVLGIVGFGRIGREVAKRAQAFGMKVLVNQRRPTPELNIEAKVQAVDLLDLLHQADFVSLHVPAKPETEGMVNLETLKHMKPSAYLINTARGSVVDENDLLQALNQELIAGAALDVFAEEPTSNNALAQHERVIATPHLGASTEDAQAQAALTVAEQIIDIIAQVPLEHPLDLHVVPLEKVHPHEHTDPRRVEKLARRLADEGRLANPPIVLKSDDQYVVLDGATRVTALKQLNYPHSVVQVVSDKDEIDLHTWFHAIRQLDPVELVQMLDDLPEVSLTESDPQTVLDQMFEHGGLCHIQTIDERFFYVQSAPGVNHLDALNMLTKTYIEAGYVTRTLKDDMDTLTYEYPDLAALVVFPKYTVEQVLQIARAGKVLPSGITRFLVSSRVLRLNVDLNYLKSENPLAQKNKWLSDLVLEKMNNNEVRFYGEPVYLLDE